MANIDPAPSWADIRQLETTDRNLAGLGGVLNTQPVSIAARLNLLRDNATALNNTVAGVSSRQDSADSAIASLESQVLDAPGTLSDLDHGAPISVAGDQFPDVLSIDNSRGPVLALNESISDLAQRDEWLKVEIEGVSQKLSYIVDSALSFYSDPKVYPNGSRILAKTGEAWDVVSTGSFFTHPVSGIGLKVIPVSGYYSDHAFFAFGIGADETAQWQSMATNIPSSSALRVSSGEHLISQGLEFTQSYLVVSFLGGALIKQASNTPTIDTLLRFSGNLGRLDAPTCDANLAGNPTYTGRGQVLEIAGNGWSIIEPNINGSQKGTGFGTALYVTGNANRIVRPTTNDTGDNAIRNRGDFNEYENVQMYGWKGHAWVQDASVSGAAQTYTRVSGGVARTNSSTATEAFLVDPDGIQAGQIDISDVYMDNQANTHANILKFVYVSQVNLSNVTCRHAAGPLNCSLRLQEKVDKLSIQNCRFDGSIAFGGTDPCDTVIGGASIITEKYNAGVSILGVNGSLVVDDGVEVRNIGTSVCSTSATPALGNATTIRLGKLIVHGVGSLPCMVQLPNYSVTQRGRIRAGQVSVATPLRSTGTMRSLRVNGRWVGLSETQDAASRQGDDFQFLVGNSDIPPRESEGWVAGWIVRRRAPVAGGSPGSVLTVGGASGASAWVASTAYALHAWAANGGNVYVVTTAGTSATSGGPTGTGASITDGTVVWSFVDTQAVFKALPNLAA